MISGNCPDNQWLGEAEHAMICSRCQHQGMQLESAFRYPVWVVATGAIVLCMSLATAVAGVFGLAHGLANTGKREGPDFAAFGGSQ